MLFYTMYLPVSVCARGSLQMCHPGMPVTLHLTLLSCLRGCDKINEPLIELLVQGLLKLSDLTRLTKNTSTCMSIDYY